MQKISANDGKTASFSVKLNANHGTTEVVGYPSDQCLIYSALPHSLTSSYDVTPPSNSSGLDYEFAYDIWLTNASAATSYNWNDDLELMIWTYVISQRPAGSKVATLGRRLCGVVRRHQGQQQQHCLCGAALQQNKRDS